MTFEEFGNLVQHYQRELDADRTRYENKLSRLVWFGYLYIIAAVVGLFVALLLSPLLFLIHIWAAFIVLCALAVALFKLARALTRPQQPFDGTEEFLSREQAPGLYRTIEELGGHIDSIEIINDLNAAVTYLPRFGLLGAPRHHMIIGLKLLLALSEPQARAVIAHELGHINGGHTKQGQWLYGQRRVWIRLRDHEDLDELSRSILDPLLKRILPRFDAMSFVLARALEYEADQASAHATSPQDAAAALVRIDISEEWAQEQLWEKIDGTQTLDNEPPRDLFSQLATVLKDHRRSERSTKALERALAIPTSLVDTHPSLSDRLNALKITPDQLDHALDPIDQSAAEVWLTDLPARLATLDQLYFERANEDWKTRAQFIQERDTLLERIESGQAEDMSEQEASRVLANLRWDRDERELATSHLRQHLDRWPDDHVAMMSLGQILLSRDDEDGVKLLQDAVTREVRHGEEAIEAIINFYLNHERLVEADKWRSELERWYEHMRFMRSERWLIGPLTDLIPHQLDAQALDHLKAQIDTHVLSAKRRWISGIWIAQKQEPEYFPDEPLYTIGFTCRWALVRSDAEEVTRLLCDHVELPGEFVVFDLSFGNMSGVLQNISSVEGSRLV
jgi:Zn-dependent protease with chaperone function